MSRSNQLERAVKLELVASIARSQHALARILESVADVAVSSEPLAQSLRSNIEQLCELQQMLAESVTGIKLGKAKARSGRPAGPWINRPARAVERTGKGGAK